MANILNYIKKYKDVSFDEMSFNDVDAVILSQIPYYDFSGIVDDEKTAAIILDDFRSCKIGRITLEKIQLV